MQRVERLGRIGAIQVRIILAPAPDYAVIAFANNRKTGFGEVWHAKGLTYDLLSAALCPVPS